MEAELDERERLRRESLANRGITERPVGSSNDGGTPPAPAPTPNPTPLTPPEPSPAPTPTPTPSPSPAPSPEPAPSPAPVPEPAPEPFNEAKWLQERYKGKFNSPEELDRFLTEAEERIVPASGTLKRLNDFIMQGGTEAEYFATQAVDHTKTTDFDEVVASEKRKFPHIPVEDISWELKRKYGIGEDGEFDETAVRAGQIALKKDGQLSRDEALKLQAESSVPLAERQRQHQMSESAKIITNWNAGVDQAVNGFTGQVVPLDEKGERTFKADATPEDLQVIAGIMKDPMKLLTSFPSPVAMRDFLFKAFSYDKLAASVAKTERDAGAEGVLKNIENPHQAAPTPPSGPRTPASPQEAMRQKLEADGSLVGYYQR